MFGLTPLGTIHTALSLVALGAGIAALLQYRHIGWATVPGKVYVAMTILTCLTGFAIFQHGGFGKPHALGVITLVVMAAALGADLKGWFGDRARYVASAAYSMTFFFHWIPGITETGTRLPADKPLFASPEAPELQVIAAVLFVVYLAGATWQVWQLKGKPVMAEDVDDETPLPR